MPPPPPGQIRVASTSNKPEIEDRLRIARAAQPGAKRKVLLSLGPDSETDLPMPDVRPGDRLRLFAELEVTTDYQDPDDDGLVGSAYSYSPRLQAALLLAADEAAAAPEPGRAIQVGDVWSGECTHDQHHRVIVFADFGYTVPAGGIGWGGPVRVNVALSAAHPKAGPKDVLLIGQNERTPVVGIDMAGIRAVRIRPADQPLPKAQRSSRPLVRGISTAEQRKVVFSQRLVGLRKHEQLLVKSRLVTDSASLGYPARITTRLFVADDPALTEPAADGHANSICSWKGHLSKPNGFNCLPAAGPMASQKFGVLRVLRPADRPLYVNMVAVSGDPTRRAKAGDVLPITAGSFIEVTRIDPELHG